VCDLETSRLRRLKTRKWVVNASRIEKGSAERKKDYTGVSSKVQESG
jgi:hypothetical protein